MSLLFSAGIAFGTFRVDVIEFFVQAEQVDKNTKQVELLLEVNETQEKEIEILKRHINNLYKAS